LITLKVLQVGAQRALLSKLRRLLGGNPRGL